MYRQTTIGDAIRGRRYAEAWDELKPLVEQSGGNLTLLARSLGMAPNATRRWIVRLDAEGIDASAFLAQTRQAQSSRVVACRVPGIVTPQDQRREAFLRRLSRADRVRLAARCGVEPAQLQTPIDGSLPYYVCGFIDLAIDERRERERARNRRRREKSAQG